MKFRFLCLAFSFWLFLFFGTDSNGLNAQITHEGDQDAIELITKISNKINNANTLQAQFEFKTQYPESDAVVNKGNLKQSGKRYRITFEDQSIICDGTTVWTFLKNENEVQITDYEESDSGLNTPIDLLEVFNREAFHFGVINILPDHRELELKSLQSDSDYFKVRLNLDDKKDKIESVHTFYKNGSRYILDLHDIAYNPSLDDQDFTFDPKKYEGIYIEDLRL